MTAWWCTTRELVAVYVVVGSPGPLGLLLGPVLGAVAGEFLRAGDVERSARSGIGALVGMAVGIAANLGLAVVMIALFLVWVWRG